MNSSQDFINFFQFNKLRKYIFAEVFLKLNFVYRRNATEFEKLKQVNKNLDHKMNKQSMLTVNSEVPRKWLLRQNRSFSVIEMVQIPEKPKAWNGWKNRHSLNRNASFPPGHLRRVKKLIKPKSKLKLRKCRGANVRILSKLFLNILKSGLRRSNFKLG